MSVVVASPASLETLARTLIDAAGELAGHAARLAAAAGQFIGSGSEVGGGAAGEIGQLADALGSQASTVGVTGVDLVRFVGALEAADRAGAARLVRWGFGGDRLVLVSEVVLATFAVGGATSLVGLLALLRRRRELIDPIDSLPPWSEQAIESAERVARLDAVIGQIAAVLDAGRPPGWAGVGPETWSGAGSLFASTALGAAMALASRPSAHRQPFVAAALAADVLITPARLAVLVELDRLVTAPIGSFTAERTAALADPGAPPMFDWSSDSCSGPVVDEAAAHCLQHDFIYRNARMVRDQWGLPQDFAEALKRFADDRFSWAVLGDTPRWPPRPELYVWSLGAGAVVHLAGSVSTPWRPPAQPH